MSNISTAIDCRIATLDDVPFITNALSHAVGYRHDLISKLIKHWINQSSILIAYPKIDQSQILGFICFTNETLHFCYVKLPFRNMGILKTLIKPVGPFKYFTINCTRPDFLMKKYKLTFRPLLLIESFL